MKTVIVAMLIVAPVQAATLRPFTSLNGPSVSLSDLFSDVTVDRVLGPAPAPGGTISVEAGQLAAIARQFNVDWRPVSPADRAVLDRPGRALGREDVIEPLKRSLVLAGAPPDVEVELAPISAPLIPDKVPIAVEAGPAEFEPVTGRFTVLSTIVAPGIAAMQVRLSGRTTEMVEVVVPKHRILPGERLLAADLSVSRVRVSQARGEVVKAAFQALGLEAHRSLQPGQAIQLADIGRPTLIAKGSRVSMTLSGPGIELSAQGVAMEAAGLDEVVPIINPASKIIVRAVVIGMGRARVIPGDPAPTSKTNQVAVR